LATLWLEDVDPSPKLHDLAVTLPVEVSDKLTRSGAVPLVGLAVKLATGGAEGGGGVEVVGTTELTSFE
jgi:hypothetical protein